MPETRYKTIKTYDKTGKLVSDERIPYEVSDEQLAEEKRAKATEKIIGKLASLSDAKLDRVINKVIALG